MGSIFRKREPSVSQLRKQYREQVRAAHRVLDEALSETEPPGFSGQDMEEEITGEYRTPRGRKGR